LRLDGVGGTFERSSDGFLLRRSRIASRMDLGIPKGVHPKDAHLMSLAAEVDISSILEAF
jgi:hypothetical protein